MVFSCLTHHSRVYCHFHLQIHLFDIDIPGKITFIESKTIAAGQTPTVVDTGRFVILLLFMVVVVSVNDT